MKTQQITFEADPGGGARLEAMADPREDNVACSLSADGRIVLRLPAEQTLDASQAERLLLQLAETLAAMQPPLTPARAAELLCLCRRTFARGLAG